MGPVKLPLNLTPVPYYRLVVNSCKGVFYQLQFVKNILNIIWCIIQAIVISSHSGATESETREVDRSR